MSILVAIPILFNGTVYAPNAAVTYGGNSSVGTPGCFQLIASSVTFLGNTKLDNSKCKSDGAITLEVLRPSLVGNDEKARSAASRRWSFALSPGCFSH